MSLEKPLKAGMALVKRPVWQVVKYTPGDSSLFVKCDGSIMPGGEYVVPGSVNDDSSWSDIPFMDNWAHSILETASRSIW